MPPRTDDETVQFSEPKRGIYKKLIVRQGRLVGGILMGDIEKAAYLMQTFDRDSPLPEERLSLLFDLGGPSQKVTIDEMPAETQVCNCNGVTKAKIGACVAGGKKTAKGVMEATRAGMGCGSCKTLVNEVVAWFAGGALEEDPSVHYYVPCIPLQKPELIAAIREQNLKSVSAVFKALAFGGREDPLSKPPLASLLITLWAGEYEDERDARFINDRVHGNIQKDGTFSIVPEMPGGITSPAELRRIADVAEKYDVPLVKLTGGQRIDLVGVPKDQMPGGLAGSRHAGRLGLGQELPDLQELHRHRLLPLRPWRQHGPRAEDRIEVPRHRQPGQAQARDRRLPAQLLRSDGEGRGRGLRSATASGRSISAARRARISARATCSARSRARTR